MCPSYCNFAPVTLHTYNAPDKVPYSAMPLDPLELPPEKDFSTKEMNFVSGKPESEVNTPSSSVPTTPVKSKIINK